MFYIMRNRIKTVITILLLSMLLISCSYRIPYLSLDVITLYTQSDVTVNYSYVCENNSQRCVYRLYNKALPSEILYSNDGLMPETGVLTFSGLADGDYKLFFSVYSEKDGVSSLLKFLDNEYDFTVDVP